MKTNKDKTIKEEIDNEPDWFDLHDWVFENFPRIYDATKYLSSMTSQRKLWLMQWVESGKPNIQL